MKRAAPNPDELPGPLAGATQLVVVITEHWADTSGVLVRFERDSGKWIRSGTVWPVVVGRAGLGWGRGLHGDGAPSGQSGPTKREGDRRAPAGAFRIGAAHGYDAPPAGVRLRYERSTARHVCVDDPQSAHYGRVVDRGSVTPDWSSAETMLRNDGRYRRVIVVEHNARAVPGAGSCIFLHVWKDADTPTVGCTAMAPEHAERLLAWLDPAARYVALPRPVARELRARWQLPDVTRAAPAP